MQRQTARMLLISAVALVVLFSAGEVNGQSCSSEGACCYTAYRQGVRYQVRSYVTSSYCCRTSGWKLICGRNCYSTHYYSQAVYYTQSYQQYSCCSGYTGNPCRDINECSSNNGGCQHNCNNTAGSHYCTCYNSYGWTESNNGQTCTDVNECAVNNGGCAQVCVNTAGSYNCLCRDGWNTTDNGQNCQDINECLTSNGGCQHNCFNTEGSFNCSCDSGYDLASDGFSCPDINECNATNGGCADMCTNTDGSYECSCSAEGYQLGEDEHSCVDTDECAERSDGCNHICENTVGNYSCSCFNDGYRMSDDQLTCLDIDECMEGTHNCSSDCVNEVGTFRCTCTTGYSLQEDKASCTDTDECAERIDGCNHICENTVGNYSCSCFSDGYRMSDDQLTCIDIDECADSDNGGCQQICKNSIGSYSCDCEQGYKLLTDGTSCEALPCPTLIPPLNGSMLCTGMVTGHNCTFTCDPGHALAGSSLRQCLPTSTWSGARASCNPMLCEPLGGPANGFVRLPCFREFTSTCNIQCDSGYQLEGPSKQTCVLTESLDGVEWTEEPTCVEVDICASSPCEHGGNCTQVAPGEFSCNCDGTGYKGPTCDIGTLATPRIAALTFNQESEFEISANLFGDLTVRLSSDDTVVISPDKLVLTQNDRKASFSLQSRLLGLHTLTYSLSGSEAELFETPSSEVFQVAASSSFPSGHVTNQYFTELDLEVGLLREGCCLPYEDLKYTCLASSLEVNFVSMCGWSTEFPFSLGLVFAKSKALSLPLSIAGVAVDVSTNSPQLQLVSSSFGCNSCPDEGESCYSYAFTAQDAEDLVKVQSLGFTYLRNSQHLLPPWIQFNVNTTLVSQDPDVSRAAHEYLTSLVVLEDLPKLDGCENIQAKEDGLYSVLQYTRTFLASISGEEVVYTSNTQETPCCFAVNLCSESSSTPFYIGLSAQAQQLLRTLPSAKQYLERGWEFTIKSAALFNSTQAISPTSGRRYWNGVEFFEPSSTPYDLQANLDLHSSFNGGNVKIDVMFLGTAYYLYGADEDHRGSFSGSTDLLISVDVFGERRSLLLADSNSNTLLHTSGSEPDDVCSVESRPSGLAFKLTYKPQQGQEFFSSLLSFTESALQCPMDAFINSNSDLHFKGLSLYTDCPDFNIDRLSFTSMYHKLYFPGDTTNYLCLPDNDFNGDFYSLYVFSFLKTERLSLGKFFTLLPTGENVPTITLAFSSETGASLVGKLHSVSVSLLGAQFNTKVNIHNGNLQCTADVAIFGNYPTTLNIQSPTSSPWRRLPLKVEGTMNSGPGSFLEQMQMFIQGYLQDLNDKAIVRKQRNDMSLRMSQMRFERLQNRSIERERRLNASSLALERAITSVMAANSSLLAAEAALDTSNAEVMQLEEQLQDMCMEQRCEETCLPGVVNNTCYQAVSVQRSGRCNHTFSRYVVESVPYTRMITRWDWTPVCQWVYSCYCNFFVFCSVRYVQQCRSKCVPRDFNETRYELMRVRRVFTETRNCPSGQNSASRPYSCPMEVDCAQRIDDPDCVNSNIACRAARQTVFDSLDSSSNKVIRQFQLLDTARRNLSLTQLNLARVRAQHERNMQQFSAIQQPLDSAKSAYDISIENHNAISADLSIFDKLLNTFDMRENINDVFRLTNITFDISFVERSPTIFPMTFSYEIPAVDESYQSSIAYDFTAPGELRSINVAEQVVEEAFYVTVGRRRRRRRQEDGSENGEGDENKRRFEENCADWNNMEQYFSDLFESLQDVEQSIQNAANLSLNDPSANTTNLSLDSVNTSVLEDVFNVSSATERIMDKLSNSEELKAVQDLRNELQAISMDLVQSAADSYAAFAEWQVRLDLLHNQTGSVGGYPCFGLTDCLATAMEVMSTILKESTQLDGRQLLDRLAQVEARILDLGESSNLNVSSALQRMEEILNILKDQSILQYWCSKKPTITKHPSLLVEVPKGGQLNLSCEAESNLTISYQWNKDGNAIANSDSNRLTVTRMQREDAGNYTCVARNAVGSEESVQSTVIVYETPVFYLEPVSTAVLAGDENGAWFGCNATSWPNPGWKWHFRTSGDSQWIEIEGEDTNELRVIKPQAEHEGWYRCVAYNKHSYLNSEPAFLRVLPISIVRIATPLQIELVPADNTEEDLDGTECTEEEMEASFLTSLMDTIDLKTTSIHYLKVQKDGKGFVISFTILSKNLTTSNTSRTSIGEIIAEAIPTRADLMTVKEELQNSAETISVLCNGLQFVVDPGSLTFFTPTYVCPEGQQLDSTYFLCVGCAPGAYQTMTDQVRVVQGKAYMERYPVAKDCPIGTFSEKVGSTSCQKCSRYLTTENPGSSSQENCYVVQGAPELNLRFINNTPRITMNLIEIEFIITRPTLSLKCTLNNEEKDCSSGYVNFTTYTSIAFDFKVSAYNTKLDVVEESRMVPVSFDTSFCSVHLINDGVRVDGGNLTVEFVGRGPATMFKCSVDRKNGVLCESPFILPVPHLSKGRHLFRVVPLGCGIKRKALAVRFTV